MKKCIRKLIISILQIVVSIQIFIKYNLLGPWFVAYYRAVWNEYLSSWMYEERKKVLGRQLAKEQFFTDVETGFARFYKKSVLRNKKLMLKIILAPYSIDIKEMYSKNNVFTRQNLWG